MKNTLENYGYFQKNIDDTYDFVSCETGNTVEYNVPEIRAKKLMAQGESIVFLKLSTYGKREKSTSK